MSRLALAILLVSLILNGLLGFKVYQSISAVNSSTTFEKLQQKYPLLSKRILSDFPQDILINFVDLRKKLRSQVSGYGNSFGFYFEYLPTGTSVGVNDKEEFHAASLFKLPVVMAYYHLRERKGLKDDPLVTIKKEDLNDEFGDLWKKGAGYNLNLSDAVGIALQQSDNTAAKVVADQTSEEDFNAVYEGLDIDLSTDQGAAILSAKNYASILKALYFSSVLNKDDSEHILDLITKTKFADKLAAGIPNDVLVAHKIGDWHDKDNKNKAFSDCGIVYVPRRPYILCMLSFTDEETARERMQAVSKTIYDYISSVQ